MLERDARTKWCPFARGVDVVRDKPISGANRGAEGRAHSECLCIASDCMAWVPKRMVANTTQAEYGDCSLLNYRLIRGL